MPAKKNADFDAPRVRAWCAQRQGVAGALAGRSAAEVLAATGWVRSVGGSAPYLALFDRAGLSREEVDRAVAALEVHELPSARGCTYVVPASDYALALRASQGHSEEATIATAKKYLGVTEKELGRLCDRVLDALSARALDPAEIKDTVGDAVRSLGPEGKRRGQSSTLPLALGRLQSHGEIRRVPTNGRLDQQRYRYVRWTDGPLARTKPTDDEVSRGLAERFFRWAGVATVAQFAWWSALGAKSSRAAASELGLVPLADGDQRLMFADDRDSLGAMTVPEVVSVAFVSSLDNTVHLRREVGTLLDPGDATVEVLGEKGSTEWGRVNER